MSEILQTIWPIIYPWLKIFLFGIIVIGVLIACIFLIIAWRRRKWRMEIHEQRADGKLHTIGYDTIIERKLRGGTKTIYWLKKNKCEVIPPPQDVVDRYRGKDEVDYLRIERDYVPSEKKLTVNYNDPEIKRKVASAYDKILARIRSVKTTYFTSQPVRDRFIYIPINKTLTANIKFTPIDYDMNMMAVNEINNSDEFFKSKYEWWKKYGAVIMFGVTIVFLIVVIVLSYEYVTDLLKITLGRIDETSSVLERLTDSIGGGRPPV